MHMLEESMQHKRSDLAEIWERVKKGRKEKAEKDLLDGVTERLKQALILSHKHHHLEAARLVMECSSIATLPPSSLAELERIKNQIFDLIFQDIIQVLFLDDLLPEHRQKQQQKQVDNSNDNNNSDDLVLSPLEFDFNPLVDPISFLKGCSNALLSLSLLPKFVSSLLPRLSSIFTVIYEAPPAAAAAAQTTSSNSYTKPFTPPNPELFKRFSSSNDEFLRSSACIPQMFDSVCQRFLRISSAFSFLISFLKEEDKTNPSPPGPGPELPTNESKEMLQSLEGKAPISKECIRTDGVDLFALEKTFILSLSGTIKGFIEALIPMVAPTTLDPSAKDKFSFLKTLSITKAGLSSIPLVKKNFKKSYYTFKPTKEVCFETLVSDRAKATTTTTTKPDPSLIIRDPYHVRDGVDGDGCGIVSKTTSPFKEIPGMPKQESYAYIPLLSPVIHCFLKELHSIFLIDYGLPFEELIQETLDESIIPLLKRAFSSSIRDSFLPPTPSSPLPLLSTEINNCHYSSSSILKVCNVFLSWWKDLQAFSQLMRLSDADRNILLSSIIKEFLSSSEKLYHDLTTKKGLPCLSNILSNCDSDRSGGGASTEYLALIERNHGDRSLTKEELIADHKLISGLLVLERSIGNIQQEISSPQWAKDFSVLSQRILIGLSFEIRLHCIYYLDLEHREGCFCGNGSGNGCNGGGLVSTIGSNNNSWINQMITDMLAIDSILKDYLPYEEYHFITKDIDLALNDLLFKNFKYIKAMDYDGSLKLKNNLLLIRAMIAKMELSNCCRFDLIEQYYDIAVLGPKVILDYSSNSSASTSTTKAPFSKDQLRDIVLVYQSGSEMMGGDGSGGDSSFNFQSLLASLQENPDPGHIETVNEDI